MEVGLEVKNIFGRPPKNGDAVLDIGLWGATNTAQRTDGRVLKR